MTHINRPDTHSHREVDTLYLTTQTAHDLRMKHSNALS